MNSITPFFWFANNAQDAAAYYVSLFPNSRIVETLFHGDAGTGTPGTVLTVTFELNGTQFIAMNGGSQPHPLTPGTSFLIHCQSQEEIDHYWNAFSEGGSPLMCGWITDRFGVTWQVTPDILLKLIQDSDPERSARVMKAMMEMVKLEIAPLLRAYEGA